MSTAEVNATGEATAVPGSPHDGWPAGCAVLTYTAHNAGTTNGVISPEAGLEQLTASRDMRTPDGIGIGSSIEEVNAAFSQVRAEPWDFLEIPASNSSVYRMQLSSERVQSLSLELNERHCTI